MRVSKLFWEKVFFLTVIIRVPYMLNKLINIAIVTDSQPVEDGADHCHAQNRTQMVEQ